MHIPNFIDQLRKRIEILEKRLTESDAKLRDARDTIKMIIDNTRHDDAQITDLFERMRSIELHLFPNLPDDMHQLGKIIGTEGGDNSILNSLDRKNLSDFGKKPKDN